jgi:hypothetical protein
MSLSDAFIAIVPTAVQLLATSLHLRQPDGRGMLAYLVRVLPLLNKEARDLWRKEYDAQLLLTLCDYLFDFTPPKHRVRYLDGVLPNAANDPHNWIETLDPALMPTARPVLELPDINQIRKERAKLLSEEPPDPIDETETISMRFMLSIVQEHLAFKQHPSYTQHFMECQRSGCPRPALITPHEQLRVEGEEDDTPSDAEYWKCCRDGNAPAPQSSLPSVMSFCCHGCYRATNSEFKRLVKFDIVTPPCPPRRGKGGAPTPERLYRAAIKRNMDMARSMRVSEQVETTHYPSSYANREALLRGYTTMLSVDLGLLYAASIIHELPESRRPRRALPCSEDWRNYATCYVNAIVRVRAVYLKYGNGKLSRGETTELWLRRLRDRVLTIFA